MAKKQVHKINEGEEVIPVIQENLFIENESNSDEIKLKTLSFNKNLLKEISEKLKDNNADLYNDAFSDPESREALKKIVKEQFGPVFKTEEDLENFMRHLVGLGFVEELVDMEELNTGGKVVTDISFIGDALIVEGNGFPKKRIDLVTEEDAQKIIAKFSNVTKKEITPTNPILNTGQNYLRLNAVHKENAVNGTTMAIRIARKGLALNEDNFEYFAPRYILNLFKAFMAARSNIFIAGDTGTGKTEVQKLHLSFVPFEERVCLIESTRDMYAKELFPDKDIMYWLTSENVSVEDLISKAALRSHPIWIMVAEVLGKEVYQMVQGILTGHKFTSTLHAVTARAIPRRLLGMAKMGYQIDEKMFLDDIYNYVDFGYHCKKSKITGYRYLSEIVEYHSDHTATTVFRQIETKNGGLRPMVGKLSAKFEQRLIEFGYDYEGLPKDECQYYDVYPEGRGDVI